MEKKNYQGWKGHMETKQQSFSPGKVSLDTFFIPLCGCQRRHRYHSANDIVAVVARSQRHLLKIPKVMEVFLFTLNWQTMQRPVSSRCFLRLKRHTTTLRGVRCTIIAGRLPRWTTTALRSYTWWLSPKCMRENDLRTFAWGKQQHHGSISELQGMRGQQDMTEWKKEIRITAFRS